MKTSTDLIVDGSGPVSMRVVNCRRDYSVVRVNWCYEHSSCHEDGTQEDTSKGETNGHEHEVETCLLGNDSDADCYNGSEDGASEGEA